MYSILGMNLFGCKFCDKLPDGSVKCDRKNFDSLLWALVTVFQVYSFSHHLPPSLSLPHYSVTLPLPSNLDQEEIKWQHLATIVTSTL